MRARLTADRRQSTALWGRLRLLDINRPWNRIVAYAVPTLAAFIAVQTWLEPGKLLGSGDLAPLLTPGAGYRSHWNQFSGGSGGATYDVVQLPLAELQRSAHWLGLSEVVFQQFWITGLYAGAAAAVVYLTFGLVSSPLAAGTAGLLATFNAYRLTTTFDTVPLVTTIAAAVLGGMIIRAARGRPPHAVSFALCSPLLALSFINPPHLALVAVWLVFCCVLATVVWGRTALDSLARFLVRAIPLLVVASLWWIIPVVLTLTGPTFNELFAAPGVSEWKFTHQRSSIENVLRLRSQWGWNIAEYFPYSPVLGRLPFNVFAFFLPSLAGLGIVLSWRRRQRLALALAAFGIGGVWVAKGIHSPLAGTNWWLYDHVPGFFLLREPAKVSVLIVLAFAILGGLAVHCLAQASRPMLSTLVATILVGGAVAYSYPLLTGEVIPGDRGTLPSAHVRIPPAWREAADFLNAQPEDGKVLVLPPPDFYALPTTWGYYGASFARSLIDRGVIEPLRQSYFRTPESVFSLVAFIEENLANPTGYDIKRQMQALGARYVLLRHDLAQDFQGRQFTDPDRLARGLFRVGGFKRIGEFGLLEVYRLDDDRPKEVFSASPIAYRGSPNGIPAALEVDSTTAVLRSRRAQAAAHLGAPYRRVRLPEFQSTQPVDPAESNPVRDCAQYDRRAFEDLGLVKRVIERGGKTTLQLQARHHAACVTFERNVSSVISGYRLAFDYRTLRGLPARTCLWEHGPNRCARLEPLNSDPGWHHFEATVDRGPRTEGLVLYFYADGPATGLTTTEYRDISLTGVLPQIRLGPLRPSAVPIVTYRRVSPSEFRVHVQGAAGLHLLVAAESWAPGWRLTAKGHDAGEATHVRVNGYENGWLVPWRGDYDAKLFYAPERYARAALWSVPFYLLLALAWIAMRFLGVRKLSVSLRRRLF
jgi:hypothetical protein